MKQTRAGQREQTVNTVSFTFYSPSASPDLDFFIGSKRFPLKLKMMYAQRGRILLLSRRHHCEFLQDEITIKLSQRTNIGVDKSGNRVPVHFIGTLNDIH